MAAISGPNIPLDGLVFNMDPASNLSYPARNDPYRDQISLLLDGESLTDKSKNAVAVTVEGSVTVDSSFKKVGNSSLKFGGALADSLSVPSSSLFAFPGDFTIEFWTYANQWGQRSGATVYFCNGVLNQFQLGVYPSATQINLYLNGSSFITASLSASIVGRWVHIALVRSGSAIKIYENGTVVGSGTSSYSVPASICYIGKQLPRSPINYGHNLDGYIDDFQITKGAKYTANFTPPTAPLSLPSRIKDIKNDLVGTFTNGPIFSNTQKGMISFYNNNWIDTGTNFSNITSDISISLWMKYKGTQSYNASVLANHASSPNRGFCIEQYNSNAGQYIFAFGNGTTFYGGSTVFNITEDVWTHVVCIKSGTTIYNYVNGELKSTTSCGSTIAINASKNIMVGGNGWSGTGYWNGNIGNLKIYNKAISSSEIKQIYNAEREKYVEIPKTISGLQLWLDAADLSTLRQNSNGTTAVAANSDPIGYWADKSGNGRNVLQATSSYRPVFAAGVKGLFPGVTFDGVDDFLESTASGATSIVDSTLIMVARWNDVSGTDTPVIIGRGYTGGGEVRAFYRPSGTTKFSWGTWNGDLGTTTIDVGQNTFNIFAATQAGNQIRLYKNYSYNSYTYGNTPASPTYNQWDIGGPNNGYDQYAGITIGEVLVFNRSLEHSEMLTLLAYLNGKWGVV